MINLKWGDMLYSVTLTYWHGTETVTRTFTCREVFVDSSGNMYADLRKVRSQSGYFDGFPVESIRIHKVEKD